MADYTDLSTLLDDLVDAAIEADMYLRGFHAQKGSTDFYNYMGEEEVHRGDPGANELNDDDTTDYESQVFGYWPGAIQTIFDAWMPDRIPQQGDFDASVSAVKATAAKIDLEPRLQAPDDLENQPFPKVPNDRLGGNLHLLDQRMFSLSGTWVEAFTDHYISPLPFVLGNERALIEIVAAGVAAEDRIWTQTRQAIADLAEAGATWFRSLKGSGSPMDCVVAVAGALHTAFSTFNDVKDLDLFAVVGDIGDLAGDAGDVDAAVQALHPGGQGVNGFSSCYEVYVAIAQTIDYTINPQLNDEETKLQTVLRAGVSAIAANPATFSMGSHHLQRVADARNVLSPEQLIHHDTIIDVVNAMRGLSHELDAVAGAVHVDQFAWLRPGGIGIGVEGPFPALLDLENAALVAVSRTAENLLLAGQAVRVAANYAHAADEKSRQRLATVQKELDHVQQGASHHPAPPQQVNGPYVAPPGSIFEPEPDCDPTTPDQPSGTSIGPLLPVD